MAQKYGTVATAVLTFVMNDGSTNTIVVPNPLKVDIDHVTEPEERILEDPSPFIEMDSGPQSLVVKLHLKKYQTPKFHIVTTEKTA